MGFTAASGTLMDATGASLVCEVSDVKVTDRIGRSFPACTFRPSIDFATSDQHGLDGYLLLAAGRTLRIQLENWGMNGGVPHAQGVVVG